MMKLSYNKSFTEAKNSCLQISDRKRYIRLKGPVKPQVWHRFTTENRRNFRVENLLNKDYDEVLKLFINYFIPFEPLCRSVGLHYNKKAVDEITQYWKDNLKHGVSLACFEETSNGDTLVGANICHVNYKNKESKPPDITSEIWLKVYKTLEHISNSCNVYDKYNVNEYLGGSGLVVSLQYRNLNIGTEIFKAREIMCRALNIESTAIIFTAGPSQAIAKKCNFELLSEIDMNCDEMNKLNLSYHDIKLPILYMGKSFKEY